jgi:ketosteroid isomerase-like protein
MNGSAAEVEAAFYEALNRADIDALMLLWADDEEIVCIHPGGPRLHGHAAIQASWEAILERGGLQIRPSQLHETHNLMCAVHTVIEGVTSTASEPAHLVATNVYIKTPQGWRIVLHHVSVAPGRCRPAILPAPACTSSGHALPAPRWLPGGHLQTIYPPSRSPSRPWLTGANADMRQDGDFVDVDFVDGQPGKPFVVLFHGLEGSSDSHYARALMAAVAARGWSGAVPHFRGCSGEANRRRASIIPATPANRLDRAAPAGARHGPLLRGRRVAGRQCAAALAGRVAAAGRLVDAACAVSAPLDLARGGAALSSG